MSTDDNAMQSFGWKTKKLLMRNKPTQWKIAPDFSVKHRKEKLQRKVYCKMTQGYAIDIMVIKPGEFYYLLIQNINTRYLYAFP
jgi:signal peptidase I